MSQSNKGLFQYNRLPFGIASAPAIFQRHIESVLSGLDGVYVDNILLTCHTLESHVHTFDEVLRRLQSVGLWLNRDKCYFLRS